MGSPAGQAHPPAFSLLTFLIVALLLFAGARSEDSISGEGVSAIRLPSEGGDQAVCASSPAAATCPVRCFRPDPVCGVDGVTYWCGCADAACVGVRVAKLGFCEVGNGGSGLLSGQALLLVHIVWLIVLGFSVLFGLF
ncbi:unnamed protein product [Spirodela intermedia]|uniref:Uncharacterized protein n=1 Tax=Spirodela intermedia TaxID=51605 RepID=A0A7I8LNR5_SPIIN|nr:unnamed protein product [Spirodela intermedia]